MKTMPVSEFKAKCLSILKELNDTNQGLTITKHGRPYAEVRPAARSLEDVLKRFRGSARTVGDIVSPIDERWEAAE